MYYTSPNGQCSHCDVALKKDYFSIVSSLKQREALLSIIDEQTYNEIRGSGGFRLGIPVLDDLLSAGADWASFSRAQRTYLEQVGWNWEFNNTIKQLQVVTSPAAYRYWSECVQACARSHYGFYGWVTTETKDAVMVTFYFNETSGTAPVLLNGVVIGGKVDDVADGKLFPPETLLKPGDSRSVVVKRIPDQTMTVGITPSRYEGFLFYSEWGKIDPREVGTLLLETTTMVADDKLVGSPSVSKVTPNHHNDDDDGQPRSPDGKWRASDTYLELNATAGRVLRDPSLTWKRPVFPFPFPMLPPPETGSGHPSHSDVLNLGTMDGGKKAVATVRAWTLPIQFTLTANEWEPSQKPVTTAETSKIAKGRPKEVRVPTGKDVTLHLTVDGVVSVCKAGEDSKDGVLRCIASVPGSVVTVYVYRYD